MATETRRLLESLEINIPSVKSMVRTLSGGMRQAVAISKYAYFKAKLVIMDEPTAALGFSEAEATLELIKSLKKVSSVVVITHNLQHIFYVVDRIVVLRHGQVVGSKLREGTTQDEISALILGRPTSLSRST
jgi:ABC-type sugar transport system ATPase subunit